MLFSHVMGGIWPALLLVLAVIASQSSLANEDQELSLADLLDLRVAVATKKDTSIRETAGIVTVITREQILNMGARDVVDVLLRAVPGYSLVTEIEGVHLFGIRGINAIEGKFLVMINGLDINEEKFGIVQFGKHFPIQNIERIEVIRGPGSSIYGGYASLGVINIITRNYNRPGSYIALDLEQGTRAFLGQTVAGGVAVNDEDLKFSSNIVLSKNLLNDRNSESYYGDPIDFSASAIELASVTFDLDYKGAYAKGLVDLYRSPFYYFDEPDNVSWQHIRERWDTYQIELGKKFELSESLQITPYVNYKRQFPYWVDQGPTWFRNQVERKTGGFTINYEVNENISILGGYQGFIHTLYRAKDLRRQEYGEEALKGDPNLKYISYRNDSLFVQLMSQNPIVNVIAGARYDKTDIHGDFFAPRVGLTKVIQGFHAKYMLGKSFRVPAGIVPSRVENPLEFTIKPETTLNNELEVGYQFHESLWGAVSFFDHLIYQPIVYIPGEGGKGFYENGGRLGTQGIETEWRFQDSDFQTTLTYSFYRLTKNDVESAIVPGHKRVSFGQAQHKASLIAGYRINETLSINPSATYIAERYTYIKQGELLGTDDKGKPIHAAPLLEKLPAVTLVNLNLRKTELFGKRGLEGALAVHNLTDADFDIAQPYKAQWPVAPIPHSSRSYMLRMQYEF